MWEGGMLQGLDNIPMTVFRVKGPSTNHSCESVSESKNLETTVYPYSQWKSMDKVEEIGDVG